MSERVLIDNDAVRVVAAEGHMVLEIKKYKPTAAEDCVYYCDMELDEDLPEIEAEGKDER